MEIKHNIENNMSRKSHNHRTFLNLLIISREDWFKHILFQNYNDCTNDGQQTAYKQNTFHYILTFDFLGSIVYNRSIVYRHQNFLKVVVDAIIIDK